MSFFRQISLDFYYKMIPLCIQQNQNQNLNKIKSLLLEYESQLDPPLTKTVLSTPITLESHKIVTLIKSLKQDNHDLQSKLAIFQESFNILQQKHQETLENHSLEKLKYEGTIARNLTMIENLLKDKQLLNEELEKLLKEKNELEHKKQEVVNFYREKLRTELKTQKENLENLEKQRRKQWYNEKTKEIKDMTVKGLEPELAKMLETHKKELKGVEDKCQFDIQHEKERLKMEFEDMRRNLALDFEYKDEMRRRKFDSLVEEEVRIREGFWEGEKQRICNRFEEELEQKEMQRKIEAENFDLKLMLLMTEKK